MGRNQRRRAAAGMHVLAVSALLGASALAGCGSPDEARAANGMAQESEKPFDPAAYAGMWQQTTTILSADIPGAPPEAVETMNGQVSTDSYCVTEAALAANAVTLFMQNADNCTFDRLVMEDGTVEADGSCAAPGGQGRMLLSGSGTYSETDYRATSRTSMTFPGGEMRIEAETIGHRTGDC